MVVPSGTQPSIPSLLWRNSRNLRPLAADTSGQLDVLGHNRDTLGVDGAQVSVLEETNEVSLSSFLEAAHSRALESEIGLEVLSDLTNKPLERKLADEELGALLIPTDLTESNGARSVPDGHWPVLGPSSRSIQSAIARLDKLGRPIDVDTLGIMHMSTSSYASLNTEIKVGAPQTLCSLMHTTNPPYVEKYCTHIEYGN